MHAPANNSLERFLIKSWERRHLRFCAVLRIVAGIILGFFGVLTLAYSAYGWAALFLVPAALNLALGYWELAIAGSGSVA